jgi:peroxiredoxin
MSVALGTEAPQFDLPGVDAKSHSLDSYAGAEALVLVQSCNHCPYVLAWEDRLNALQREYSDRGVAIVAVCSNDSTTHPGDSFENMVEHAREKGYAIDYLHDEDQALARALGSERTPEVFVFDGERRLRYHGAIDDDRDEQAVAAHFLRDALDAVLAGGEPEVADTPAVGCTVKWREG